MPNSPPTKSDPTRCADCRGLRADPLPRWSPKRGYFTCENGFHHPSQPEPTPGEQLEVEFDTLLEQVRAKHGTEYLIRLFREEAGG